MKIDSFHSIIQRTLGALLVAATMATAGCIEDSDPCLPDKGDKEGLHLRFDIVTRGGVSSHSSQSRALQEPDHTETGSVAENYLDIPNLTFLIFDKNKQLLTPFYPRVEVTDAEGYTHYQVNAVIQDIYFDFPRQDPQPAPTDQVPFYILVLANYSNYQPLGLKVARGMSLDDFFGQNSMTFATPSGNGGRDIWYPHPEDFNEPWSSFSKPQFIPMAGLQSFAPTVQEMMTGDENNPFRLDKDINMLRAMAKIEVVDKIGILNDATVRPADATRIDKVELRGYNNRGALLPVIDQWSIGGIETQYVTETNVPAAAQYNEPYTFGHQDGSYMKSYRDFFEDKDATASRADGCKVFSVYVPEYNVPTAQQALNKAWVQVTVMNPPGSDVQGGITGDDGGLLYQLRLAEYPLPTTDTGAVNENAVTYIPLLRNNIYRYEILSVATNIVNLQWTVCPMDKAEIRIPNFE